MIEEEKLKEVRDQETPETKLYRRVRTSDSKNNGKPLVIFEKEHIVTDLHFNGITLEAA